MKTIAKIFLGTAVALLGVVAAACGGKDEEEPVAVTIDDCFASVADIRLDARANYSNVGYALSIDYSGMVADITVSGLKLPNGTSYPMFTIPEVPFTTDVHGTVAGAVDALEVEVPGLNETLEISGLKFTYVPRLIGEKLVPGFCLTATFEYKYRMVSGLADMVMNGTTVSTNSTTGEAFTTGDSGYQIRINPDLQMLTVTIKGARFLEAMPANLNIVLPDIPFTVEGSSLKFVADALIPTLGGDPYPGFPVSNLQGTLDMAQGLDLDFGCTYRGTLFNIAAEVGYANTAPAE